MELAVDSCGGADIFRRSSVVLGNIFQLFRSFFDCRVWLGEVMLDTKGTIVLVVRYPLVLGPNSLLRLELRFTGRL